MYTYILWSTYVFVFEQSTVDIKPSKRNKTLSYTTTEDVPYEMVCRPARSALPCTECCFALLNVFLYWYYYVVSLSFPLCDDDTMEYNIKEI